MDHGYYLPGTNLCWAIRKSTKLTQLQSVVEMGRSDCMFTLERYRKEYLANRSDFTPPSINFRPSPKRIDTGHQSTLINAEGGMTHYTPLSSQLADQWMQQPPAGSPESASRNDIAGPAGCLSIEDSMSIEEIIEQMREAGSRKD